MHYSGNGVGVHLCSALRKREGADCDFQVRVITPNQFRWDLGGIVLVCLFWFGIVCV